MDNKNDLEPKHENLLQDLQISSAFTKREYLVNNIIENEILGVATFSPEGILIEANNSLCKLLGYSFEELKGKHFKEITDPRDYDVIQLLTNEIIHKKKSNHKVEKRYITKSGASIWVELNLFCYRNPLSNEIEFFTGILQDINERKISEEKIRLSEQKYKLLFDQNPIPLWMLSIPDYTFLDVNQSAISNYGYSREEFLKLTAKDIRPEEDVTFFLKIMEKSKSEYGWRGRARHKKKNGELIHVEIFSHNIMYEGKLARLIMANDVTEKLRIEERLKSTTAQLHHLYETMENSFWGMDIINQKMLYVSPGTEKVYGYPQQEFLDNPDLWWDKILEEDRKYIEATYPLLYNGETGVAEFRIRHADGSIRWLEGRGTPMLDENMKLIRVDGIVIDISARKNAEEAIKLSETRLNEAQRVAKTGSWELDLTTKHLHWSDEVYRIFEIEKENFTETTEAFFELVHPDDRDLVDYAYQEALKNNTSYDVIHRLLFKDGRIKYVQERCINYYDSDGNAIRSIGTVQDITERKNTEMLLDERERSYQRVVENISDAVMIDDISGKVVFANDRFLELFGLNRTDLENLMLEDYVAPEYHAELRDRHNRRVKGESVPIIYEYEGMRKNGCRKWLEVRVSLVLENGVIIGTQSAIRDITERKEAELLLQNKEKQIREISSSMPGVVYQYKIEHDGKREYAFIGENIKELIGLNASEIYKDYTKLNACIYEEDLENVRHEMAIHLLSPGRLSLQFRMKDVLTEQVKWVSSTAISSKQNDGTFILNGTLTDITDRKKSEEELNKSYEDLRQLTTHLQTVKEEERSIIAREIHDELGQQLTGLKMDAAWLAKRIPQQDLTSVEKITGMISLIDDTMKTVRHISSKLRPVILDDLGLIDALDWQSNEFEKRTGIRCIFKASTQETAFDKNLSTGIFRVYQETLTNAARHSLASEIKTTFQFDDDNIILKVKDNGQGFDEKEIKNKNTLGLLGMRERAVMFGGKLRIDSVKGKGTTVILRVPNKTLQGKITEP